MLKCKGRLSLSSTVYQRELYAQGQKTNNNYDDDEDEGKSTIAVLTIE